MSVRRDRRWTSGCGANSDRSDNTSQTNSRVSLDENIAEFTRQHPWVTRDDSSSSGLDLPEPDEERGPGEILEGVVSDLDVDPVESVREIREP